MSAPTLPAAPDAFAKAADILRRGGLVALPTETVYGLAAQAGNAEAVARIFAVKGRPAFNPLIVHVTGADQAAELAVWTPLAQALAKAFWPGPLTLVAPRRRDGGVCDLAAAGLDTLALRAPAHPAAQAVIAAAGPLAMPSANPSGLLSPTTAADLARTFPASAVDLVIDAGPARHGLESTVVDAAGQTPAILRPGPITAETLQAAAGDVASPCTNAPSAPRSPGQSAKHYAPARARLRIQADRPEQGEAYLGFGPGPWGELNLSPTGDLIEAAANLFAHLNALDAAGYARIAVAPIPAIGLGRAINDRLARAATN